MLSILFDWAYIGFISCTWGLLALAWVQRTPGRGQWVALPRSAVPFLGLAIVAVLLGYQSLVVGIGPLTHLLVLVLMLAALWPVRKEFRLEVAEFLRLGDRGDGLLLGALGGFGVLLAQVSSIGVDWFEKPTFHYDTGFYHAQAIRWIEQFPAVPGLGNLHAPLAYDSAWFLLNALFGFSFLFSGEPLHALNGFAVLVAFCLALGGLREVLRGSHQFSSLFRVLMLWPLVELAHYMISPSTDEPAAVFTLVTLALACRLIEAEQTGQDVRGLRMAVAVLALGAVGIKLSVLPLLLLLAAVAWRGGVQTGLACGLLAATMLLPKLLRSLLLSGYLLYPLDLDLFAVDWKIPLAVVAREKRLIEIWSRVPDSLSEEVLKAGFGGWFPGWFADFRTTPLAFCLLLAAGLLLVALIFRRGATLALLRRYAAIYLVTVITAAYWFLAAPYIRYGFGALAALAIVLALPAAKGLLAWQPALSHTLGRWRFDLVTVAGIALLVFSTDVTRRLLGTGLQFSHFYFAHSGWMISGDRPRRNFVFQQRYPEQPVVLLPLGTLRIYRPVTGDQCWSAPLPCTPLLYERIVGRGSSLRDGFRVVPGALGDFDGARILKERSARGAR
jgi:hypothetical protein